MKAVAAILLVLMASASAQPLTPESDSDEAGLMMQVAKVEDGWRNSAALIRDAPLNSYVGGIVCRVAASACPSLRVYVVEAPGLTIVSLPNGAFLVGSGTLLRADDEAELAQLLGHEIAHYLHKDSLRQFERMLDTSGVVALLGVAASGLGAGFVGTPASMAALNARYAHSADEENAARLTGFELATAAGYDPQAASAAWRNADDGFRKLHPGPALFPDAPGHAFWKLGIETHARAVEPYLQAWVDDELRQRSADQNTAVVLFSRLASSGRGLYRYALGEAYRKRGRPGDFALAEESFRAALAAPDAPPVAWRGLGLAAMQDGDKKTARTAFAQYRAAAPNADDKAMIDYYLAQL